MNRPTYARTHATRRRKFAVAIASIFAFGSITQSAMACDYCDQGDGGIVCDSACGSPCDNCGGISIGTPNGPVFRTLDAFAGGLEKFLGLDKCVACDSGCDDACDASMIDEMMMYPAAPATTEHVHPQPVVPSVPPEIYSQPHGSYSQPNGSYSQPLAEPPYVEPTAPQPMPEDPAPTPVPNGKSEGGLFDTLENPFNDDEVRKNPWKRKVQPSSYQNGSPRMKPSRSISKYLNSASANTNVPHRHASHVHRAATAQRAASSSLKRAAARTTNAPQPTATRQAHQHNVHQHSGHQVQLTKAPTPKKPVQSVRSTAGQQQTYRPTTQRPTVDSYYRR